VRTRDAALFGLFTGLGLITKTTAILLVPTALALAGAWLWRAGRAGWRATARALVRPSLASMGAFLSAAGWWCGKNLVKFGHPFPHEYVIKRRDVIAVHPIVGEPLLYHRPIGWYLPFEFEYLEEPFAPWSRPNFWSQMIAGTWVDDINHGFCRMVGGGPTRGIWRAWLPMSERCIHASVVLVWIGLFITLVAAAACILALRTNWRSGGRRGSFVVPVSTIFTIGLLMWFATMYPFDHHPVVKASYAMNTAPALCASFGLAIAGGRSPGRWARLQSVLTVTGLVAIAVVGVLVAGELWWI
jgi:hypothetical protein